jgi:uncharacterized radical SAM protein YgiQ
MTFSFLPTTTKEMHKKGWDSLDIILVTGDAYIDHPSFGASLIGRYLESHGYKVGIIAQPDWNNIENFQVLGKPNLFFGVTAGNLDSLIANYTSEKRKRKTDSYSENGTPGLRPDRASLVYCNCLKQCYPDSIIVLGGIEASLRRLTHYDYWSDKLRRSILFDSRANILVYGMGEKALISIAERVKNLAPLTDIPNTAYISNKEPAGNNLTLESYETLQKDKKAYAQSAMIYAQEIAKKEPRRVIQACQNRYTVIEPPKIVTSKELDDIYHLPFTRLAHPKYQQQIPAYSFVKQSVVSHRGCYGGCSFCSLGAHQGKYIVSRTANSIISEIKNIVSKQPDFKGTILDVGGPSANMFGSYCLSKTGCSRTSCLYPNICKNLKHQQLKHLDILKDILKLPNIKNVFINSGIRIDLALQEPTYIDKVCEKHVCGQLSVAPEHSSTPVLNLMHKYNFETYKTFIKKFQQANKKYNKKQFTIPYFIAAHPGCSLLDMYELAIYLKENRIKLEQVQNFIPIPLTLSEAMYYSGYDVYTMKKIPIPKGEERLLQRALLQPHIKSNHNLLRKALKIIGKEHKFNFLSIC